ncbi:methylmalonyl Co-A mutase-associated GTPase MeaB [Chungangia koreensis]|uniref:Methylmalonyl Co-A mutase-associated GTPase MeaB n=1 Tax=Chungangia koreensis TaxID=752657 RepID=A0ABV8X959_9LACT
MHQPKRFKKISGIEIPIHEYAEEIRSGSRLHLSKAITLIESMNRDRQEVGQELLQLLLPVTGRSIRIGITGVPGAGKSTFIETFGMMLCEKGHRVAVLAVDPSSSISGGSILGDKTRMQDLSRHPNAFIRPSPSAGTLGGVHRKTRETMLLCEAAGYDVILIETVGVGQSETIVRGMVDYFLLLVLTGAGDELQSMKKGIMELTDAIVVNKADGDNEKLAKKTVREYKQILHFLQPATPKWTTSAFAVSSLKNIGLDHVWKDISEFQNQMKESGYFDERRKLQTKDWFRAMITDRLIDEFFSQKRKNAYDLESQLVQGELTVSQAVDKLFKS